MNLTENAILKLKDILAEENNPNMKFRIGVQGGGCNGMSYFFVLDDETAEDDFVMEFNGIPVLVDSISNHYLSSAEIDWQETQYGSGFDIFNPLAATTCGCGSSFSPY